MSWMASARVAGSLLSLPRLITGNGRRDNDGRICTTWLAMDSGKKQAGMPSSTPDTNRVLNRTSVLSLMLALRRSAGVCNEAVVHARSRFYRPLPNLIESTVADTEWYCCRPLCKPLFQQLSLGKYLVRRLLSAQDDTR